MKRNKLLNSTTRSRLFTTATSSHHKHRHLLSLSALALAGIFLTTIVLATSEPASIDPQSQIIALPKQSKETSTLIPVEHKTTETHTASSNIYAALTTPQINSVVIPVDSNKDDILVHPNATDSITTPDKIIVHQNTVEAVLDEQHTASLDWVELSVKSGDNLSLLFPRAGLTARDVYNVAQTGDPIKPLLNLKPGQTLRFGIEQDDAGKSILRQLELQLSPVQTLKLTSNDNGYDAHTETRETQKIQSKVSAQIENSLFTAGMKVGMSDKLIMEMAHIFGWDIDFALDIRKGDSFKVIFEEAFLDGEKFDDGDILAAEFTNQGKTFRAIRYTDDEGNSYYFAPNGDSMRKTFTRTPVHFSRISSKFNPNRKHPVLKTSRPHRGVDYAAATGTPILATGDGKVDFIGTKGGYGRTVILAHGGKYTTLYAHMSRFKSGLKRGQRVKQGQTIGYIGSSGLATGPHLHYEFRVSGVHHNPLTVALPKAEPLAAKYLSDFKSQAQPLLAQLDQLSVPLLASN